MKDNQMNRYVRCRSVVIAILCVLLSACGNKVGLDNYNKLRVGQTFDEIKTIIGPPARCDETYGVRTCLWGDDARNIKVSFVSGMVMVLSAKNLD